MYLYRYTNNIILSFLNQLNNNFLHNYNKNDCNLLKRFLVLLHGTSI